MSNNKRSCLLRSLIGGVLLCLIVTVSPGFLSTRSPIFASRDTEKIQSGSQVASVSRGVVRRDTPFAQPFMGSAENDGLSQSARQALRVAAFPMFAPSISATKTAALTTDVDSDTKVDPGDTLTYTVTISNTGPDPATGVTLTDTIDPNTTLIGASVIVSPIAVNDTYNTIGNVNIAVPAPGVITNDLNPNITGTLVVTQVNATAVPGGGSATSATTNGSVTLSSDGSFTYNPNAGFTGSDTFNYTLANGTGLTDTATVTITISGRIWFVNSAAGVNGDGRLSTPFNILTGAGSADTVDAANDVIFLYSSATNYTGGLTLNSGEKVIGQGASQSILTITGFTAPSGTNLLPATNGTDPKIVTSGANAITLGTGNGLHGFTIGDTTATGIDVTGTSFGNLTVRDVTLNGTGGALNLSQGTIVAGSTFDGVEALNNTGFGVRLDQVSGSFTITTTNIVNSSNTGIDVQNCTVAVGGFNFGGTTVNKNSTSGTGVNINADTGTTSFSSLAVTTNNGTGVSATSGGTVNVTTGSIAATGGPALLVNPTTLGMTFTTVSSTASTTTGISLTSASGSLSITTTTITDAAGIGISVGSSSGTIGFGTTSVTNPDANATGGTGVSLTSDSATITFGDLDITPEAGQRGFHAVSCTGTITATSGDIVTSGHAAVEIVGVSSGSRTPLNMTLTKTSATGGPPNGILLQNVNGPGGSVGFVVNGGSSTAVGGDASGGTITNATGADGAGSGNGVYLENADEITLRRITINGTNQNHGIRGVNVSNVILEFLTVTGTNGNNTGLDEGAVNFDNLTGSAAITSCLIEGGFEDNLNVVNTSGTLNRLTVTGSTFGFNNTVQGNNNILIESQNSGTTLNFTIQSCLIKGARADWLNSNCVSSSTMDMVVGGSTPALGNTFDNTGANAHPGAAAGGNRLVTGSVGSQTVDIRNNTFKGSKGEAIRVRSTATGALTGTVNARVRDNVVGVAATPNSGSTEGSGIFIFGDGGSDMNIAITNNQVHQYNNHGIRFLFGDEINPPSNFAVTMTGNTVSNPGNLLTDFNGCNVNVGSVGATDDFTACLDIGGAGALKNVLTSSGSGVTPPNNADLRLQQRFNTSVQLPGYTGPAKDAGDGEVAEVDTYLSGRNTLSTVFANNSTGAVGGYFNSPGGAPCTQPTVTLSIPIELSATSAEGDAAKVEPVYRDVLFAPEAGSTGGSNWGVRHSDLLVIADSAIAKLAQLGVSSEDLERLKAVQFEIADLPDDQLAITTPTKIIIDSTAADYGWFIDGTPGENDEFEPNKVKQLKAKSLTFASDHMDLLTVITRSLDYVLEHDWWSPSINRLDLMQPTLPPSTRRLPLGDLTRPRPLPLPVRDVPADTTGTVSVSPRTSDQSFTTMAIARLVEVIPDILLFGENRIDDGTPSAVVTPETSSPASPPATDAPLTTYAPLTTFAPTATYTPAATYAVFNPQGSVPAWGAVAEPAVLKTAHSNGAPGFEPNRAVRVAAFTPMSGETVTRSIGTLPAGESVQVKFAVTVDNPFLGATCQVSNQGTVSGSNFSNVLTDDPGVVGSANPTVTPLDNADLSLTKSDAPDPVLTGNNITYTVNFTNGGPSAASTVTVTDAVPANTTFVSASVTVGTGWSTSAPSVGGTGNVVFSKGTVANAETATFQIVVNVNAGTAHGTVITNTATAATTTNECDLADNTATATTTANKSADLAVTKSDSPDPVFSGTNLTYTINFTNNGPTNAPSVTVTDAVPANTTFVSASVTSGTGWSTSSPAVGGTGNVVFSKADVANAETATFQIVVNVDGSTAAGTIITNNAVAASTAPDPTPANNTGTATTTVAAQADLAVTKSDSPDPVLAGANITYTVNFVNNGPGSAQTVTVTDAVPANTTFVSAVVTTGTGWSTSSPAVGGTGNVIFSKASVANAETAVFTIVVKVNSSTASGTTITNSATAASTTTDPTPANNTGTATTTVATQADLAVTKSDAPDPVVAGNNITYTINFVNNGPSDAQTVTVTDAVPANTTFVSASVTTGTGWSTSAPSVGGTGNVVFSKATVAAGETAVFSIVVKVTASTANGTTITNTATAATVTTDPTAANNSATATTTVNAQADLAVTKSDAPDPVIAGQNITYTINFVNNGPSDAQTVTVTDATPANTTFVSASVTTGTGWSTSSPSVGGTGNVVFSKATVAAGETAVFSIVVQVNGATTSGTVITNSATAASTTTDPTPANNTGTTTTTVDAQADLSVTKSDAPDPVDAGTNITYTINLSNAGPSSATTVTVTDAVPANTTFVSASVTTGTGWSISSPPVGGTGNVVFSKAAVANGETAVFSMVVLVSAATPNGTVISNSATAASATTDPTPANNTATATTTVVNQADISVTKGDAPDPVIAGNNITYTISFANGGPTAAISTTVTDATPAGTTFVSASVTTGTGWSTSSPAVGGTGNVVFSKASVANGETATFTIVVKVNASVASGSTITNSVTAASSTTDPTPGNNTATATTTVATQADLAVTKIDSPDPVSAGGNLTYTINFANNGPSDASTVTVTDAVPANTTFVSAVVTTGTGWSTSAPSVGGTGNIVFSKAAVAAGETAVFTIVVNVNPSTADGATITNSVTAASTTTDPTPANNTATATTTVDRVADLAVTKGDAPDPVIAGNNITYTINFVNNGPSDTTTVTVTDAVPANTTFVSASVTTGTGWSTSAPSVGGTGNVVFSKAAVVNAETAVFSIVVKVGAATASGTTITNSAMAAGADTDGVPANNTATATTTVNTSNDLSVLKTDSPDPVVAGANLTYTINLASAGPSNALTVAVADPLPAGTTFVSAAVTTGTGWSIVGPAVGVNGTVTFSKGSVAPAETAVFSIVVKVASSVAAGATLSNTATVTSATGDATPGNNSSTATTTVQRQSDLMLTKTATSTTAIPGGNLTYTISVTNAGPSDAANVVVTDPTPANTTFVSASVTTGTGWSISAPPVGGTGNVVFSKPAMVAGETAVFSLVVKINSSISGSTTITNTVTGASDSTDPVPANSTATSAVSLFDTCIYDPTNKKLLRFSRVTGAWQFFDCSKGTTASGMGLGEVLPGGCKIKLTVPNPSDPSKPSGVTITATANICTGIGTATVTIAGVTHTLNDPNVNDGTCSCPPTP